MNKLTLDDLRRKYSDRPQPAEVEKLTAEPIYIEPNVPDELSITPEVTQARMSTTPLVGFLVFAGVALFAGFAVLVNIEVNNDSSTQNVLGAADIQKDFNNQNVKNDNVAPEDIDIAPVVEDIYDIIVGDNSDDKTSDQVVEDVFSDESVEMVEEAPELFEDQPVVVSLVKVREVEGGYVNLRRDPLLGAFSRSVSGTEFELISELVIGDYTWVEVKYDENSTCWIRGDLVEKL